MISGDRSILQGKKGAFWYTLEEFRKYWERIDVICPQAPASGTQSIFENVFFHPSPWGLRKQPAWIYKKGTDLARKYGHQVLTIHEYPPFYNGRGGLKVSRTLGIPAAIELHHLVGYPRAASFTEFIGKYMSRIFLPREAKNAAAVRVVNPNVGRQLVSWGVAPEKIVLVPSFYLDAHTLVSDSSIRKTHDLVFCGRLVANKGLDELLRAMTLLPKVRLLVIGDGPLKAHFAKLAEQLGLLDRVFFQGWLAEQGDVLQAMQTAKIFVMNSKSEGGPRVALEAMAIGMPVIVTPVGVMPDVIEDGVNGVFTTGDAENLAEKIRHLLLDPMYQIQLGNAARGILKRFDRKVLIAEYAEFLQSLA
jgi:glycosyltransferase involved in cell wall biosynthesis